MMYKTIFFSIAYYLGILDILRFVNRRKALILLYHGVSENFIKGPVRNSKNLHIDAATFRRHIRYLKKKKYNIISVDDLGDIIAAGKEIPIYTVAITFDDGYRNVFDNAYPILQEYGISWSMFLTSGLMFDDGWLWLDKLEYMVATTKTEKVDILGQGYSLKSDRLKSKFFNFITNRLKNVDEESMSRIMEELILKLEVNVPQHPPGEYRLMNYEQVRQMARDKSVSFGAHTSRHTILILEKAEKAKRIILESKKQISEQLGQEIRLFSYPNGSYNSQIKEMVREAGFKCALTTNYGMNDAQADPFELKRVSIGAGDSLVHFIAHLSGIREYTSYFMGFLRKIVK